MHQTVSQRLKMKYREWRVVQSTYDCMSYFYYCVNKTPLISEIAAIPMQYSLSSIIGSITFSMKLICTEVSAMLSHES